MFALSKGVSTIINSILLNAVQSTNSDLHRRVYWTIQKGQLSEDPSFRLEYYFFLHRAIKNQNLAYFMKND